VLLLGVPLVVAGSLMTTWFWGDWSWLPTIFGFSACILLTGIGLSSVTSARFPYPVVKPGDSPFAQPQSSGTVASLVQSLSFFAILLLAAPVALCGYLAVVDHPSWHYTALIAGLVIGGGAMTGGAAWGGRIYNRRAPELLEFALQN
jgi:ABC-2 type transport system permease protein